MCGVKDFMKKSYKILIIVAVIMAFLLVLVWWQFGNIKAVYYSLKYSKADIDTMLGKTFSEVQSYLDNNPNLNVRPAKPVEEELHKEGVLNDDELTSLITEKTTIEEMFGTGLDLDDDKNFTNTQNGEKLEVEDINKLKEEASPPTKEEENTSNIDAQISDCVARMYVLKSSFVSQLDQIYNTAFTEYKALWRSMTEEERSAKKNELLKRVYPQAVALEDECDKQVDEVITKLKSLLKESGQDNSLADKIYESYKNEKSLKKAHYINLVRK